jgi:hypothetical protein
MESMQHFVVDLQPGSDPFSGYVRPGDGAAIPFVGWLALLSALQRAIAQCTDTDGGKPS